MDCRWVSWGECEDIGSAVSGEGWPDSEIGEPVRKVLGLKPRDEDSCVSGSKCEGFGCSVTADEDACNGGDGGGPVAAAAVGLSAS